MELGDYISIKILKTDLVVQHVYHIMLCS